MAKKRPRIQHAEIVQHFAAKLRELRHSRGLTQAALGRAAEITTSYVGRLESGGAAPGIDLVARLAKALDTTIQELLPAEGPKDPEAALKNRADKLFSDLIKNADRETLLILCPLLARLGESVGRKR